jgi:hypothetical protein
MGRPNLLRATVTALLCVCPGAVKAGAQESAISVVFDASTIADRLGAARAASEAKVADLLIEHLAKAVPYWGYRRARDATFPRLAVSLKHASQEWVIAVALQMTAGQPLREWPVTWLTDAEAFRQGGLPPPALIPDAIVKVLDERFLQRQREDLFKALQGVPLVHDARLAMTREPRAVLPLGWATHRPLALSDFKLLYKMPGGEVATVTCTGVGTVQSYPAPPPASGLLVQLRQFETSGRRPDGIRSHLQELSRMQPFAVFLTRFESEGMALPMETGAEAIASVAPLGGN